MCQDTMQSEARMPLLLFLAFVLHHRISRFPFLVEYDGISNDISCLGASKSRSQSRYKLVEYSKLSSTFFGDAVYSHRDPNTLLESYHDDVTVCNPSPRRLFAAVFGVVVSLQTLMILVGPPSLSNHFRGTSGRNLFISSTNTILLGATIRCPPIWSGVYQRATKSRSQALVSSMLFPKRLTFVAIPNPAICTVSGCLQRVSKPRLRSSLYFRLQYCPR